MGWIEDYVRLYHERSPQAPIIYHQTVALHVLSSTLGWNLYFYRGAKKVYPNIWAVLMGPPATSKKSTALDYGREMLHENSAMKDLQMADTCSVEGLMAELAEKSANGNCRIWSNQDEFGAIIAGMKKKDYLADLKDLYMQLYDGRPMSRRIVKMHWKIDPVYMTFISACTLERLAGMLTPDDLEDGFLSRFLLVYAKDGGYVSDGVPKPQWTQMRQDLESELAQAQVAYANYDTEMKWGPGAKQYFESWKEEVDAKVRSGDFPPGAMARMEDYFIKFCMLWELSDNMRYLGKDHVIPDTRLAQVETAMQPYLDSAVLLSNKLGVSLDAERWFDIIERSMPDGIMQSDLLRKSKFSFYKHKRISETFEESGRVHKETIRTDHPGRPSYRYKTGPGSFI